MSCSDDGEVYIELNEYDLEVISYFKEIALGFEFGTSSDITRKWCSDLKIFVGGDISNDLNMIFSVGTSIDMRVIKPQFNFNYAEDIPFYSTSHIYSGVNDKEQNQDLNNIKFCDIPWLYNSKNLKTKNWQDIYLQTKSLRQHNYDTMFDKEKLSLEINKTLNLFLEFVDSGQVSS